MPLAHYREMLQRDPAIFIGGGRKDFINPLIAYSKVQTHSAQNAADKENVLRIK